MSEVREGEVSNARDGEVSEASLTLQRPRKSCGEEDERQEGGEEIVKLEK